jgi:hypothetical protein
MCRIYAFAFATLGLHVKSSADWVLLGELDKFVPLASKRFSRVQMTTTSLEAMLFGKPGEVVHVTALRHQGKQWVVAVTNVRIGVDGTGRLRL